MARKKGQGIILGAARALAQDTRAGYSYEGLEPGTEDEARGVVVTASMALFMYGFGGKVSRVSIWNWITKGKLEIVGYVCTKKRKIPVFWSGDLARLVNEIPSTLNKFVPGTSGNPQGRPRKPPAPPVPLLIQQTF